MKLTWITFMWNRWINQTLKSYQEEFYSFLAHIFSINIKSIHFKHHPSFCFRKTLMKLCKIHYQYLLIFSWLKSQSTPPSSKFSMNAWTSPVKFQNTMKKGFEPYTVSQICNALQLFSLVITEFLITYQLENFWWVIRLTCCISYLSVHSFNPIQF